MCWEYSWIDQIAVNGLDGLWKWINGTEMTVCKYRAESIIQAYAGNEGIAA
jgi:hypothetical protein